MKKYTITAQATIWIDGDDEQAKAFAESKAKLLGEDARILFLGELASNSFSEPIAIINNLN
jgi:hypothetical protein